MLRWLKYYFSYKRKQCCGCGKTFYKSQSVLFGDSFFYVSPCCEKEYIIV